MSKKQKREYYMAVIKSNLGWRFKDFKGMTFEEIEAKFAQVWKRVEDFIPMGSKEEAERLKRKGINLEKEQVKKQKSSEEAPETETSTEEFTEDKIKEIMQLVPVEDVYVQALQVKHPIIDWKVHSEEWKLYDLSGVHHVTAKDKEIFMLVEKDYPLRRGLALVTISYRLQVENHSQMAEDLIRKIYNIANTPRKQTLRFLENPSADCALDYVQYDNKCSNPTSAISDETIANPNAQIVEDDMVRVQVPRYTAWLDYDEHVDSLSTMDNEVGVTGPKSITQTLPSF
nr:hypothetical protein [Tanacetum cinerariifolium]